ncbi:MAG: hypothetical protein WCV84_03015 [Patescibacteria group bacterium]
MTLKAKRIIGFAMTCGLATLVAIPAFAAQAELSANDLGVNAIESGNGIKLGSGDVRTTAARIINVALGFLGIISVCIVLLGGFKYMISGGQEEKVADAKNLIISGIIGLAIILSAWAITKFVISSLITATGTS